MRFTNQENKLNLLKSIFLFCLLSGGLFSVACQTKEEKTESILKKCQNLLDKDDLISISNCYADAVKSDPKNGPEISKKGKEAIFKKCLDYKSTKQIDRSLQCLEGMIALAPDSADVNFQLADSYFEFYSQNHRVDGIKDAETLERAETYLKTAIKIDSQNGVYHALYGDIFKEKGNLKESVTEYKKAVEISPDTGWMWVYLGLVQEQTAQNGEAETSYKQALKVDSNDTNALYFLGLLYEKTERPEKAAECYEKILKIEPSDEEVLQRIKTVKEQIESQKQTKPPENKTEPPKKKAKAVGVPNSRSNL